MMAWLLAWRRWLLVLLAVYPCLAMALKNAPIGQTQEIITLRPGLGSQPTQVGLSPRWLAEPAATDDICSGAICNSLRWKVPPFYSSDPFKWPAHNLRYSPAPTPPLCSSALLHYQRYKIKAFLKKDNCTESKSENKCSSVFPWWEKMPPGKSRAVIFVWQTISCLQLILFENISWSMPSDQNSFDGLQRGESLRLDWAQTVSHFTLHWYKSSPGGRWCEMVDARIIATSQSRWKLRGGSTPLLGAACLAASRGELGSAG